MLSGSYGIEGLEVIDRSGIWENFTAIKFGGCLDSARIISLGISLIHLLKNRRGGGRLKVNAILPL